jgi:hypothetical protein
MALLQPEKCAVFIITRKRTQESNYFIKQLFYCVCSKRDSIEGHKKDPCDCFKSVQ